MSSPKTYHGRCHCGDVTYQIRLSLPPENPDPLAKATRIYKCNCSTCLKLNMFHTRPAEPENDFIVTSPAKIEDLGKYNAFGGPHNWYFCKNCGAQCFGVGANWVQEELNVGEWAGGEPEGSSQKVSRTTALTDRLNSRGHPVHYVSANAVTIEGVDLIEWHEKKWIFYVENRVAEKGKANSSMRFGKPHPRGCY